MRSQVIRLCDNISATTMKIQFGLCSSIIIVSLSIISCAGRKLAKKVDLRAVTSFENIRQFYDTIKIQKLLVQPASPSDEITRTICKNIFSSHYFRMLKYEEWVDLDDKKILEELKNSQHRIWSSFFQERQNPKKRYRSNIYVYQNGYTLLPIYANDNHEDEFMFKCLAKRRDASLSEAKIYHVSREYDVSLNVPYASPIAGRFIFSQHPQQFLVIEAMAEEAARGLMTELEISSLVEYNYLRRRNYVLARKEDQDPVCKLTPRDKLRLCASLFGSVLYRDRVEFEPNMENVEFQCKKSQISFTSNQFSRTNIFPYLAGVSRVDDNYEEWTITCKAVSVKHKREINYYVSRGDDRKTIFVFAHKFFDDRIFFENYLRKVSVVDQGREEKVVSSLERGKSVREFLFKSRSTRIK